MMNAQHGDEGQYWMAIAIALLGAGAMAMAAVWLHRRILERLVGSRVRSRDLVDKSKCGKLRKSFGSRRFQSKESQVDSESGDKADADGQTRICDQNGGEMSSNEQGQLKSCNVGADVGTGRQDEHPRKKLFEKPVPENGKVFSRSRSRSRSPPMADDVDLQSGTGLHGLSRVRTRLEGVNQSFGHPGSTRRTAHVGTALMRPSTPKSPAKGGHFDIDGSDDEDSLMSSLHEEAGLVSEEPILDDSYEEPLVRMVTVDCMSFQEEEFKASLPISGIECTMEPDAASARQHSIADELLGAPDQVAADILRKEPEQETFVRMKFSPNDPPTAEEEEVCLLIQECLSLREKYLFREKDPPWKKGTHASCSSELTPDPFYYEPEQKSDHRYEMQDGVVHIYANKEAKEELFPVPDATSFFTDMHRILRITGMGNVRTFCHHRLLLLEQKFSLHLMLNADRECLAQKSAPHRDFYNVRKVDTHVHHSSCMNQKHLLRFIKSKLRKEPDEVVIFRDGQYLTLKEVFESLDLTGYDLNVDLLDVHADKNTFHRFDKFNLKYNPCGQSRLREIFLKQENLIQGRFLAELTKEVFQDLTVSKYQMAEYRISVYGRKQSEWDQLAGWIVTNELYTQNVVWLIQVPRLYNCYKKMGIVTSFQNILDNLFLPLFEVTVDPVSHPQLHVFLKQVVGFDMVDDESKPERRPNKHMQTPAQWDIAFNPAYSYWAYYVYANLYTLNKLRESKGLSTIKFRPHSGEAGDTDHLASTFLLAHCIAHGINLRKYPGLQYLYYLTQIGLAMSPLSNNSLFLDYHRNPFPVFFSRGLNVSLSTDDPLQIHLTKEPLVEEYSIAAQVWKLSSSDLCEIARNSVYQSGFAHSLKLHWIGNKYFKRGAPGNDIHKTNVPHMRVEFRNETWTAELQYVWLGTAKISEEIDP